MLTCQYVDLAMFILDRWRDNKHDLADVIAGLLLALFFTVPHTIKAAAVEAQFNTSESMASIAENDRRSSPGWPKLVSMQADMKFGKG